MTTTFQYKVRDKDGKLIQGSLEADSKALVAEKLRQMGFVPVSIDATKSTGGGLKKDFSFGGGRPKVRELAIFSRQFATMINSGLPLIRAIDILGEQSDNKVLSATLKEVRNDIERGASLSQAFGKHPKVFSRLYVAMVRAGEAGGVLDSVLLQLATTIEKQLALKRKVRSAMMYPIGVLSLVGLIVAAMLTFVVPKFTDLFASMGSKLPLPTQILVMLSNVIRGYWWAVGLGVGGTVYAYRRWKATPGGRAVLDKFALNAPVFGTIVHKGAIARFSRTLSVLLRSGVNILTSLEITGETVNNAVIESTLDDIREGVRSGQPMSTPMATHSVFPPMVVQMLAVGEETGAVDDMLARVAEFYEDEVEAAVEGLTSLLEPLLMAFLGGTVGVMVVALYMPMFDIITKVK
jgi:type IV pilus assembly protein PilC